MTTLETAGALIVALPDGGTLMVLRSTWPCPCGHAALFVVNRNGSSRCARCDEQETAAKAANKGSESP